MFISRAAGWWVTGCLTLGVGLLLASQMPGSNGDPTVEERIVSIEDVRLGDRVDTDASSVAKQQAISTVDQRPYWDLQPVSADDWKAVKLQVSKDGDVFDVQLLRPNRWFLENEVVEGGQVHLELPEQSIDDPAEVMQIGDCPTLAPGRGRIVTGLISHVRGGILNLHVEELAKPIGVTSNHPFWSEDRQAFVTAGELKPGEHLQSGDKTVTLRRVDAVPGERRVYNLEVHGDHIYRVSCLGILVHNASAKTYPRDYQTKNTRQQSANYNSEGEARALARQKVGKNPVDVGDNKLRSQDGRWQYRAKPVDTNQNHVHLEKLDPVTGEVLENWHLNYPEGS
ncbi:hypothetical protein Pan97_29010 [Bremerella volcania]|uniref:Uncharacterized protein n=1 Tax=Bremerella volcania TaxID=2527984 RepID=A0A518C9G1_9BACT|nr:Hint domain-containing protein [Bremerella volcania]QDU75859.1 hypothetical protein Pan97_29010 [Bremerella volcania]